jgi:subfamily B ATP-binding cassette protein MsbA
MILADDIATARKVLALGRRYRTPALLVVVLGLASAVFEAIGLTSLIPLAMLATEGKIDDDVPVVGEVWGFVGGASGDPILITALAVALMLFGIAVQFASTVVATRMAMRFAGELRVGVFETALEAPLPEVEGLPSGKLINNIATDSWRVCDAVFVLISIAIEAAACLVFVAFLVLISPFYTGVLLVATALMAALVHAATSATRVLGAEAVDANRAFMARLWDALSGLRLIRAFGVEERERQALRAASRRVSAVFIRLEILGAAAAPISRTLTLAIVAGMFGLAVWRGDPLEPLIGFFAIAYRMQPRVSAILGARTKLRGLEASVDEVGPMLRPPPAPGPRGILAGPPSRIALRDVSVHFPGAPCAALDDVSCAFERGRVTAIAGRSGAGKTTLTGLLLRFVAPTSGAVLVDGVPLEALDAASWHRQIGYVEQGAFLFNATVRENIRFGDPEASDEAVVAAATLAEADGFIRELRDGYDTPVGVNGVRLSDGQRQRIALARALVRRPAVLILDEATNALDLPTEHALRAAVDAVAREGIVIVIAHRRETIERADTVLVLERGRLVQAGAPAALDACAGAYSGLYRPDGTDGGR